MKEGCLEVHPRRSAVLRKVEALPSDLVVLVGALASPPVVHLVGAKA